MRLIYLAIVLNLLLIFNASAAVKATTWTTTTDGNTGTGTLLIKVPGTFATTDSTAATFSGRQLIKVVAWLESRAAGDKITSMAIKDSDGVVLPAGTTVGYLHDGGADVSNRGITLLPTLPFTLDVPPGNKKAFIPSQFYIVITFQKATPAVDTAVVNIAWDDGT